MNDSILRIHANAGPFKFGGWRRFTHVLTSIVISSYLLNPFNLRKLDIDVFRIIGKQTKAAGNRHHHAKPKIQLIE